MKSKEEIRQILKECITEGTKGKLYVDIEDAVDMVYASQSSPGSKDVEQWYRNWMAAHGKVGIVATVNVLDMLKDFAAQSSPCNVQGYSEEQLETAWQAFRMRGFPHNTDSYGNETFKQFIRSLKH